jgi:hypothetical protein
VRVFRAEPERGVYATPPAAVQRSFNDQEFRLEKAENGFRVFTLGGSSAYGCPWGSEIAFTRVTRDEPIQGLLARYLIVVRIC